MKGSWQRLTITSLLAACTFAGAFFVPASISEGARVIVAAGPIGPLVTAASSVASASAYDPAARNFLLRLERDLCAKMPDLDGATRRAVARTVFTEARAAALDPLLVLALIEVESSFDPAARSNRGAAGLMQLREATMRRERERAGLPPADPRDPVANVQAGVRYLRRLLDAFPGEELALMAYNAGPNRILGYLREGPVPTRFAIYPRRVRKELRRLTRVLGPPPTEVAQLLSEPKGAADATALR